MSDTLQSPRASRSGKHIFARGRVWYYRRVVPQRYRIFFGCTEIKFSLETASETEAKRLEKRHDADFEERLAAVCSAIDPVAVGTDIGNRTRLEVGTVNPSRRISFALQDAPLTDQDRQIASDVAHQRFAQRLTHRAELQQLLVNIEQVLPDEPLSADVWRQCREGILSLIRYQVVRATERSSTNPAPTYTIDWAYDRWLRRRNRPDQTIKETRDHLNGFLAFSKLLLLAEVRRSHLVSWRDSLVDAKQFAPGTVNQRLTLVSAVLRDGWRDAELPAPDLKMIAVDNSGDTGRQAWSREELLTAMHHLDPGSWAAWIFLIDLTTGVRLGEPMAAEISWYDHAGFIHVRDRRMTKARKLHCLPIIECLREPLRRYVGDRKNGYLFSDAPRPKNTNLKVSHEASKWFSRFFARKDVQIGRVMHELRHTWVEEARHSPIPKDIWEIISGHSKLTVSDRYGGQKPDVLAAANEKVCEFLTGDPELKAAMLRLVSGRQAEQGRGVTPEPDRHQSG